MHTQITLEERYAFMAMKKQNLSVRRHTVATVALPMPRCFPSRRLDPCVTPYFLGGDFSLAATILRWLIVRGRPPRRGRPAP